MSVRGVRDAGDRRVEMLTDVRRLNGFEPGVL